MRARYGWLGTVAIVVAMYPVMATAQPTVPESLPVELPDGPAQAGFDIERFSNAGNGWFETFYVEETESLKEMQDAGRVVVDMPVLVMDTAAGKLAFLTDQMSYHHLAQGTAGGKDWLATF